MINAQTWLDQNYPSEIRKEVKKIDAKDKNLEGKLVLQDFPNLEKFECRNNKGITNIELTNLPKLDYFHANNCQLTDIKINNCPNITFFNVANNYLSETNFLDGLNSEKLTTLSLHTNNFPKQDLKFLSKFANLKELFLDNCDEEKFEKGIYNKFSGSLAPLQNLTKLELLSIGNTNLSEGLEFLPDSFRKIGLNTSWWEVDTSCSKLRQELEETSRVEGVTEKLKQHEEGDPAWYDDYYRLAPWKEARKLLGEKFKDITQPNAQNWLNENYPLEKRAEVIFLNINGKNLEGKLKLAGFRKLQKLDCSFNQLTSLDLSDCEKLTHLNCSWNKLTNTEFLSEILNKEDLKILKLNNNEGFKENLGFLTPFVGLAELDIKDCSFFGSLEPLKEMNNLKRIFVSHTDISDGLEHLPKSCKEFYCDTSDYKYKSIKIVKELGKYIEGRHYSVSKWKEDKENNVASKVLPLERLFVIRSNIKKFINKWRKEATDNWYEEFEKKFVSYWTRQPVESKVSELKNLQSPEQFDKYSYLIVPQWGGRIGAGAGGILALVGYPEIGGGLSVVSPLVETVASKIQENLYEAKEKKWNEFVQDAEEFLDNYHELLGILQMIRIGELGQVNKALGDLDNKVNEFLNTYDKPGENGEEKNGVIDISELTDQEARRQLALDLDRENPEGGGSQLGDIVLAIRKLEKAIINYRQGLSIEEELAQGQSGSTTNQLVEAIQIITDTQAGSSQRVNEQTRLLARVEVPSKLNK